ncbi:MAG: RNA polymerase sigma factor, partial [Bacteroidota bacterium]
RAQSALYRQCFSILMGVCIRYAQQEEEAHSLLNQGFLKILQKLDTRRENVPFEAWIRRIMINTIIDEYRRTKKYRETHRGIDQYTHTHLAHAVDWNEADRQFDAEAIENLLQRLPAMTRQVFNLFAIDGYSHKEIAKMLNISDGTSKWHVSTARKQLQGMMATEVQNRLPL